MHRLQKISFVLLPALLSLLTACAHIVKPNGGPKDKDGPEIIGAIPPPQVLNYAGNEVVIYFDEFIKPGNYAKDVFVSPVPPIAPTITVKNKRMRVRFNSPLRDSTTYVITLGTGIKDFNEGNKMEKPFVYAFSTGDQLDSLEIRGKVISSWTGAGEKGMKVLLFPANEIEGNNILEQRPVYASETDADGEFTIPYLREDRYKIYAVFDEDNDYMYSNVRERIGIAANPVVNLSDSADRERYVELFSYVEDKLAPTVKSAKWANDYTIRVEFGESIRDTFGTVNLQATLLDSASGDRKPIDLHRFGYFDRTKMYAQAPMPRDKDYKLILENVMDSLGTFADTTLTLVYDLLSRDDKDKWFEPPFLEPGTNHLIVHTTFPLPAELDTSMVQLIDSTEKRIPLKVRTDGYILHLDPDGEYAFDQSYTLRFTENIPLPDDKKLDTLISFPVTFLKPESFGSLSGTILPDTLDSSATFVMLLMSRQKKNTVILKRVKGPGPFSFPYLTPGPYTIKLIRDIDKNGYLSPGSLDPYFLPEQVIDDPSPIEIKENWEVQDYNVFPYKPKSSKKKRKKDGESEEDDDVENAPDEDDENLPDEDDD